MKTTIAALCGITILATVWTGTAAAHEYSHQDLEIDHPWTRATPPGAKVAGGFMTITNNGNKPDKLIGGTFYMAERVEVHEMSVTDGIMRMQEVAGGLVIAPGATVELKPGGYHLMFMKLNDQPEEGERVKGTLRFAEAGEIAVEFAVAPLGAKSHGADGKSESKGSDGGHSGHHGHHGHH